MDDWDGDEITDEDLCKYMENVANVGLTLQSQEISVDETVVCKL